MCAKVIFNFLSRNMAFRLNQNQRIAANQHYYQCGSTATEASHCLSEEFNTHAVQGRNIKSLINKFKITGSVNDAPRSGHPITATSNEKGTKQQSKTASLNNSPQKRLSRELEISIHNLLCKSNLKPYIPCLFHALHDGDADQRVEFSEIFLDLMHIDENFQDLVFI